MNALETWMPRIAMCALVGAVIIVIIRERMTYIMKVRQDKRWLPRVQDTWVGTLSHEFYTLLQKETIHSLHVHTKIRQSVSAAFKARFFVWKTFICTKGTTEVIDIIKQNTSFHHDHVIFYACSPNKKTCCIIPYSNIPLEDLNGNLIEQSTPDDWDNTYLLVVLSTLPTCLFK